MGTPTLSTDGIAAPILRSPLFFTLLGTFLHFVGLFLLKKKMKKCFTFLVSHVMCHMSGLMCDLSLTIAATATDPPVVTSPVSTFVLPRRQTFSELQNSNRSRPFQMPGCVAILVGRALEQDSCSCSRSLGRTPCSYLGCPPY